MTDKCSRCEKNEAEEGHTCPFAEEIYDDQSLCDCCEQCADQCADDI